MVKRANKAFARLDAEATKTVAQTCHVITITVRIHAIAIFVDQMHCVKLIITQPNVNVQPGSKEIQHQNKDVFEFLQRVFQRADARTVTCASEISVKYRVAIQLHVRSVKDAIIMFALKFAIQITIAYPVKFVMNEEHVNLVVKLKLIAHQLKFVVTENVNVVTGSSEHHLDALISMNVPIKFVITALFVRIHPDHSNVFAQNKQLATHTHHPVA